MSKYPFRLVESFHHHAVFVMRGLPNCFEFGFNLSAYGEAEKRKELIVTKNLISISENSKAQ